MCLPKPVAWGSVVLPGHPRLECGSVRVRGCKRAERWKGGKVEEVGMDKKSWEVKGRRPSRRQKWKGIKRLMLETITNRLLTA